jgi:hypothetical protein
MEWIPKTTLRLGAEAPQVFSASFEVDVSVCFSVILIGRSGGTGRRYTGPKKTSPRLRGEAGFWSDVPVFRALQPWQALQFYQGWL